MENGNNHRKPADSVYSTKIKAGKRRTYFFDVKKTKVDDYYITITESTKKFNGDGFERHKLFLYKEDFNRFAEGLQDVISRVKEDFMPDYDYEEFDKKHEEWEAEHAENNGHYKPSMNGNENAMSQEKEDDISW